MNAELNRWQQWIGREEQRIDHITAAPLAALSATLDDVHLDLRFRAVSWQELMPLLELDDDVRDWAREKHGLGARDG